MRFKSETVSIQTAAIRRIDGATVHADHGENSGSRHNESLGEGAMTTTTKLSASVTHALIGAAAVLLGAVGNLSAQAYSTRTMIPVVSSERVTTEPVATTPAASASGYRVAVGERAIYDVELRGRRVGTGTFEVLGHEPVDGRNAVHASLRVKGGLLFAKVDDRFDSWFDPDRIVSRRFVQNQRELSHSRQRSYEIKPEAGTYHETRSGKIDSLSTDEPLDDVSFLFYVRTLPLRVGDVDTIPRYFKSGRNVIIRVIGKKTIKVAAGTFETIVVQPTITNAGGLFGQGGKAEVYLTDDAARTLVMLKSSVPVLGSLSLELRELSGTK
jgi:hypothetical protein